MQNIIHFTKDIYKELAAQVSYEAQCSDSESVRIEAEVTKDDILYFIRFVGLAYFTTCRYPEGYDGRHLSALIPSYVDTYVYDECGEERKHDFDVEELVKHFLVWDR